MCALTPPGYGRYIADVKVRLSASLPPSFPRMLPPVISGTAPGRLAVIGGGISGLAAAARLRSLLPQAEVVVLEARSRLGGVLESREQDGFLIEQAADNFITTPAWGVEFCQRMGLEQELIETNAQHRRAFVVHKGQLADIPAGFAVMAPSRIWPIASTPVLSLPGKVRMASEVFVPRRRGEEEESLAAFVRRRFGREVYERLVQPLIAGIYTGDPERLSLGATMPRFLEMERQHGSLIRAIWQQRSARSGPRRTRVAGRGTVNSLLRARACRVLSTRLWRGSVNPSRVNPSWVVAPDCWSMRLSSG